MDKYRRIAELMKGFQQSGQVFFSATVESVEGTTCTVKVDSLSISDVRLKATTAEYQTLIPAGIENTGFEIVKNTVVSYPAIGSDVLVGSFSGDLSNLFVLTADVIDLIEITCNGQNLMQNISDLIGALSGTLQLTTSVGAATGTFDPATIAKLKSIETAFKQIFK
jgi:hypothetical protein